MNHSTTKAESDGAIRVERITDNVMLMTVPVPERPQQLDLPPNPGCRYYVTPGGSGWFVADKLRDRHYLIASCHEKADAESIRDALEVNPAPELPRVDPGGGE